MKFVILLAVLAAAALQGSAASESLQGIFQSLGTTLTPLVAWLFALGLLVSGFASTAVGTQAGDAIMHGLLKRRVSPLIRRVIVIIPSITILALAVDPTQILLVSQITLSFGVPFALIPLAITTSSKGIMGEAKNTRAITAAIYLITAFVSALNLVLIWLTVTGAQ